MKIQRIPFAEIPQLSSKDIAYATATPELRPFFKYEVDLKSFESVIKDKQKDPSNRDVLVNALKQQYSSYNTSDKVLQNIDALAKDTAFTIVTAHQPSLFTGPLYYIYKIISAINLSEQLNKHYSNYHIVPVFVSGAEDHDFDEVNHANIFNKTITWENDETGSVGKMKTESLTLVLKELEELLGNSDRAKEVFQLIQGAYTSHSSYGKAMIHLVNELFQDFGLVILDMSQPALKQLFVPYIKKEIVEQPSKTLVEATTLQLEAAGFSGQAYAREINFFYLDDQIRERIIFEDGYYQVINTDIRFSETEMLEEIEKHPECFSPNVVMRPLYQECVLPNLAYIGGGGELAYWLERKEQFEHFGLNFPMLIRRNSVLWIDKSSAKKMEKLNFTIKDLLEDTDALIKSYVKENTEKELSLKEEKKRLEEIYEEVKQKAFAIDQTLVKTVLAEGAKQLKSLEVLESKLMRAEKQRHEIAINQIRSLKDKLFPNNGLQERTDNFIPYYLKHGKDFFAILKEHLNPLEQGFIIIEE